MQFAGAAEHYDCLMGRYAPTLAVALADAADVGSSLRVLDVGCGPGGLTSELAARVGTANGPFSLDARAWYARGTARSP